MNPVLNYTGTNTLPPHVFVDVAARLSSCLILETGQFLSTLFILFLFVCFVYLSYLCTQNQKNEVMTAIQKNEEFLRNLIIIVEDENLLKRAV